MPKKCEKVQDIKVSFDTPVLGLGQQQKCSPGQQRPFPLFNSAFYLGLNDRRRCSSNYFPLGPTQAPSNSFSAALPKPCRREKAQGDVCGQTVSISQNENNDWPPLGQPGKNILHCWVG